METPPSAIPQLRRSILYVGDPAPSFLVAAAAPCAWTATHAQNAALAAAALTEGQFSICIIDLSEPNTEGVALAHLFLQSRPDLIVILLTSYATSRAAEALLSAGAGDCWQVPVLHQEAIRRLRLCIQLVERRYECDALRYKLANISETMPPLDGLTGVDLSTFAPVVFALAHLATWNTVKREVATLYFTRLAERFGGPTPEAAARAGLTHVQIRDFYNRYIPTTSMGPLSPHAEAAPPESD